MPTAIEFNNISKIYRLGLVSTGTLSDDLHRWWTMNIRGKEDPYLKIGETNDRSTKGESDYVWALRDIDFKVEQGDVVGIIGKNGAGKSTLLKILSKVTAPTTGTIRARGRIGSLLEVGTGFHPEMTGRENIYLNGAILGMTKAEITKKLDEIVDFSGCERYIDTPVKRYSSGMMVRLGFAVAAHLDPEILVVDEVLAVGDMDFQKKAIGKMKDVSRGEGRTVLFVSHNMESVRSLCHNGIILEKGHLFFSGNIEDAVEKYLYSQSKTSVFSSHFTIDHSNYFNFTDIEILQNGMPVKSAIDVFDKISFTIKYRLDKDDNGKCVYFIIKKGDMPLAYVMDTTNNIPLFNYRKAGDYTMSFDLPCPLLKSGYYSVDLVYTAPRQKTVQYIKDCIQFEVILLSKDEFHAGYASNRAGLIAIDPVIKTIRT
jgi:lipopolysaccharide transport system ATP-binding protein